jgi:hypothetical protein
MSMRARRTSLLTCLLPSSAPGGRHGAFMDVDLAVVRDVLGNHLSDLETFVEAVRRRLKADVNLES